MSRNTSLAVGMEGHYSLVSLTAGICSGNCDIYFPVLYLSLRVILVRRKINATFSHLGECWVTCLFVPEDAY